jgi:hypothetical protein
MLRDVAIRTAVGVDREVAITPRFACWESGLPSRTDWTKHAAPVLKMLVTRRRGLTPGFTMSEGVKE